MWMRCRPPIPRSSHGSRRCTPTSGNRTSVVGAIFCPLLLLLTGGLAGAVLPAGFAQEGTISQEEESFFETQIRPLLSGNCMECHGEDVASGGLRLDSLEGMLQGGENGPAIVPGDPQASLLWRALRHDPDEAVQMPPDEPLGKRAIEAVERWIAAGAPWPSAATSPIVSQKKHWAFQPLNRVSPPQDPTSWSRGPIDQFIAAQQRERGLHPVEPADRRVLIRRATYDLTGLPPSADAVREFESDPRPDAFERVVDRLLASPHYGERWGRHWLDLVRYADTAGDDSDYPIPQAHLYRDYVIDSFNADLPYDQFLHEQLAGDILAKEASGAEYNRRLIATGFIAQAKRIGTHELEGMHLIIEDTLATVSSVMLGLSIRCARCHDHKYDPISQKDYYSLYGFFASTQYPFPGGEELRKQTHFAPLQPANGDSPAEEPTPADPSPDAENGSSGEEKPSEGEVALGLTAYAVQEREPVDAPIQKDGNPRQTGDVVPRGVPRVLEPVSLEIPEGTSGRLQLAEWLTDRASFLTARVMANRIWQYHFGKPLVDTPSDFGFRGAAPTHPELLDWLAAELIRSGWSIKSLHREIMLSRTYQLASRNDESLAEKDSGNQSYWRFDRRRLDAEEVRDTIMLLSGSLDLSRPGPHPFPDPSKWRFTAHHQFNQVTYPSDHRSVYLMVQRLHAHPFLKLFDGPDASLSTARRDRSTVPLQALFLLNNELIHRESSRFAERLIRLNEDSSERVQQAFFQALARPASEFELARSLKFISEYEEAMRQEGVESNQIEQEAWAGFARTLFAANELMFVE
jgi:hypothetical protein